MFSAPAFLLPPVDVVRYNRSRPRVLWLCTLIMHLRQFFSLHVHLAIHLLFFYIQYSNEIFWSRSSALEHQCKVEVGSPATLSEFPRPLQAWTWLTCAGTLVSVWTLGKRTTAAARPGTWAATVRSRWTSAPPTPARTGPPAQITWEDTPAR